MLVVIDLFSGVIRFMRDIVKQDGRVAQSDVEGKLFTYLCKMKGGKCASLPKMSLSGLLCTALGSFVGIGLVAALSDIYKLSLLLPSFGASAVLLYAACHVPMAQPRNVIGGHLISAFMGVLVYQMFGDAWWTIALGVTLAIMAMTVTYTLHPPGGATAFLAVYTGQDFGFIMSPVGVGALCLICIALLVNNLSGERKYPDYWY
ncbi:HPP family protein [Desulfoscipio gibsoniae]|uniref:CBS-domain-containing membrane protein n=1 Tax=Desulfoscipio gibsoniae DSM 7213 TaxID=767817 RepID=R4KCN4_9FIRM|nr:HPP family protein [Desulfoscipio gibsoniae]AGL00339.1 CBS-domain-containing membrane protein [Desulfoscipio gibsoniae DSM 7213]